MAILSDAQVQGKPTISPLPWHATTGYIGTNSDGHLPLASPFREGAHRDKHGNATPTAIANAKFIVRCVNAHDDLLEACKAAVRNTYASLADADDLTEADQECWAMLEAAIAKAEAGGTS